MKGASLESRDKGRVIMIVVKTLKDYTKRHLKEEDLKICIIKHSIQMSRSPRPKFYSITINLGSIFLSPLGRDV